MESCSAVGKEEEKLSKKYKAFREHTEASLEDTLKHLSSLREELSKVDNESQLTSTQLEILGDISKKVDNIVSQVAGEHKDMHGALSKIGKSIDRNFVQDNTGVSQPRVFVGEKSSALNEVLCQHFFRQGRLEIGESLVKEADLSIDETKKLPFTELNFILDACRQRCLDHALRY
ncbi:Hypothetical predicted protein [Paramuricea clavata]|uniref:Uncharacterized protein n=1 Tax=Paramuricea clavata TaxID=317549 RepID=A0A6S7HT17_PARCT|nr:Hypothetical predicted protein [Paramuricea clavata]